MSGQIPNDMPSMDEINALMLQQDAQRFDHPADAGNTAPMTIAPGTTPVAPQQNPPPASRRANSRPNPGDETAPNATPYNPEERMIARGELSPNEAIEALRQRDRDARARREGKLPTESIPPEPPTPPSQPAAPQIIDVGAGMLEQLVMKCLSGDLYIRLSDNMKHGKAWIFPGSKVMVLNRQDVEQAKKEILQFLSTEHDKTVQYLVPSQQELAETCPLVGPFLVMSM